MFAKTFKIVKGECEPTQARARVGGRSPNQTDKHGGGSAKQQAVQADEEDAFFVRRIEAAGTTAV